MGASGIEAGAAFVRLSLHDKQFVSGIAKSRGTLLNFASFAFTALSPPAWFQGLGNAVSNVGKKATIAGVAMGTTLIPALKAASDATETLNKFQAVFGTEAANVGAWIENLAGKVGRSATDIRDAISAYQAFFVGLGFGAKEAAGMSKEMAALAIDLGSFFNLSDAESNERFMAALSGSAEVLDRFGINTKQAALEAELGAKGIKKAWTDVTESEKAMARMSLIRKAMTSQGAIGDAAKTIDSPANLLRQITGGFKDFLATVGAALMPVLQEIGKRIAELVRSLKEWAAANPKLIATIGNLVVGFVKWGAILFVVGKGLALLGTTMSVVAVFLLLAAVVPVVTFALFKLAAALKLVSVTLFGFKVLASTFGGFLLSTTLVLGTLAAGILTLGAVMANAKLQGISWGDSVLDLANRFLGLNNAYTQFRDNMADSKSTSDALKQSRIARGAEATPKAAAAAKPETPLTIAEKDLRQKWIALREKEKKLERLEPEKNPKMFPQTLEQLRFLRTEKWRIEQELVANRRSQTGSGGDIMSRLFGVSNAKMFGAARDAGKSVGVGFWEGMINVFNASKSALKPFFRELARVKADAIEDPTERARANENLEAEEKIADAKSKAEKLFKDAAEARKTKGGEDRAKEMEDEARATLAGIPLIGKIRDAKIANIDAVRAREIKEGNAGLADDLDRAKIEEKFRNDEAAKRKALLQLDWDQAKRDAGKKGLDVGLVDQTFATRMKAMEAVTSSTSVAGTFGSLAGMGTGSPDKQTADNTKRANGHLQKLVNQNAGMLDRFDALKAAFQFTA